jgi:hypothetical protein
MPALGVARKSSARYLVRGRVRNPTRSRERFVAAPSELGYHTASRASGDSIGYACLPEALSTTTTPSSPYAIR